MATDLRSKASMNHNGDVRNRAVFLMMTVLAVFGGPVPYREGGGPGMPRVRVSWMRCVRESATILVRGMGGLTPDGAFGFSRYLCLVFATPTTPMRDRQITMNRSAA